MKIALISSDRNKMHGVVSTLETHSAHSHSVIFMEDDKSKILASVEREQPDLLLIEGMFCNPGELDQIEQVTTRYPRLAVILLCATHTPEFLIHAMRAGVREVLSFPVPPGVLEAAVNRIAAKLANLHAQDTGKVLAFIPCKGGSGATFLATNLGYQLAESSTVLLIDLNLQFGDALSFVHDEKPAATLADIALDIHRLDASFLAASAVKIAPNYSILAAPEDPSQALGIKPEHIDTILKLAVTQYDFVLLDLSRTLDTFSIKALDHAFRIYPVLQAGLPYLRNANKLLSACRSLGYPSDKIEFIVNRFEKGREIGLDDMRRSLGDVKLHTVPNSYKEVSTSINHGNPLVEISRSNAVTKNLMGFALSLNPKKEANSGLLGRLFKWA